MKGAKIAYISSRFPERDAVVLRDLVTGSMSLFHGDSLNSAIHSLTLSTELIAYVTSNEYLHVARFTEPVWSTRHPLPSAQVRALGADDSTVAVAIGENGCNVLQVAEILLFDAKSHQSRTIEIALESKDISEHFWGGDRQSQNSCSILVDSRKEVVDIFSLLVYEEACGLRRSYLEILHLRVTFAGENVNKETWCDVRHDDDGYEPSSQYTMAPPAPSGYRGQYRIQVGEIPLEGGLPLHLQFDTFFDADKNNDDYDEDWTETCGFINNEREVQPTAYEAAESPYRCDQILDNVNARWKGLAIQATEQPNNKWLEHHSLMNDTFLVSLEVCATRMEHSRVRVFCFDPKVDLHGGRSTRFWKDGELQPGPRWREKRKERSVDESDQMSVSTGSW